MEETLIIVKPDAMKKNLIGEVLGRFEKEGLHIRELFRIQLAKSFVEKFYNHLNGKVHEKIVNSTHDFMISHPVIIAILEGENAVARARKLCGPTDPAKAPKGTIRGDLSNDNMEERTKRLEATYNIVHSSGSIEEAKQEIGLALNFIKKEHYV